jgi:hypothetical protein
MNLTNVKSEYSSNFEMTLTGNILYCSGFGCQYCAVKFAMSLSWSALNLYSSVTSEIFTLTL